MSTLKNGNPINKDTQFGSRRGNRRSVPKEVAAAKKQREDIVSEMGNLLDPNLSIDDYKKIYSLAEKDSGLRGVFALAIINKDYGVIFKMMERVLGKPKESIDHTTGGQSINPPTVRIIDERKPRRDSDTSRAG